MAGVGRRRMVLALLASARPARRGVPGRDLALAAATCRRLGPASAAWSSSTTTNPTCYAAARPGRPRGRVDRDAAGPAGAGGGCCSRTRPRTCATTTTCRSRPRTSVRPPTRCLRPGHRAVGVGAGRRLAATVVRDRRSPPRRWRGPAWPGRRRTGARRRESRRTGRDRLRRGRPYRALLAPPARRPALAGAVVAMMLVPVAAAAVTAGDTEHRVDLAQARVARRHLRPPVRCRPGLHAPAYRRVSACCRCVRGRTGRVGARRAGRAVRGRP